MRQWFVFGLLVLLGAVRVAAQAPPTPQTQPLLQASDVKHLGSFLVPARAGDNSEADSLTYGGAPLAVSSAGLYVGCHLNHDRVAEISIPALTNPAAATILQNCADIPGHREQIKSDSQIGGILLYGGRKIVSAFSYYDAAGVVKRSHAAIDIETGAMTPWVQVGGLGGGWVGGLMTVIPAEWQELFGGPAFTGLGSISIISRSSSGPTLSVFNPDDIGHHDPIPATLVLGYPLAHPLGGPAPNPWYQQVDSFGAVAFPSGTRTILFTGRHGAGQYCYGLPSACGNDPVQIYQGGHAYPYVHQVWAYDANDLLRVKRGELASWEVRPYATWPLPELEPIGTRAAVERGSATYDPATRRLYAMQRWGGGERRIHVYAIASPVTPTPEPEPDIFEHVETFTRTLLCSRSKGICTPKP